jgi:RNA polymerase sigma-70 factor (ECF subfamily)
VLRVLARLKADSPEEQLVAKAQEGDAEAFRWLFERHVNAVRRFLGDMLPSAHLADEAAQETFVRAHRLLPRLQDRLRVKPWLLAIARLVALEQIRQQRGEAFDEDAPAVVQAVIPSPDPEAVLLDKELHGQFSAALASLSTHRRAALVMRLDHGLTYDEIADAMGWSLAQVKNEIHRARLQLRTAMQPHLGVAR